MGLPAVIERAIDDTMPMLANILAATPGLPARSFKAGFLSQMVNSKAANKLVQCTLPSLLNCASTFAGLGLMPDGVTGQAYMLPFAGTATPVIGYKGYNTLGERAGRTIDGEVVRDGDEFDWERGTSQWVKHKQTAPHGARIIRAWGAAMAPNRAPIICVLSIEELEAVRNKSPAGNKSDSPWMDLVIGRPAMYAKTAKRRLARGMPLLHGTAGSFLVADTIEGQFEATSRPHYLLPGADGQLQITDGVTGERVEVRPPIDDDVTAPTKLRALVNPGQDPTEFNSPAQWKMALFKLIELCSKRRSRLERVQEVNTPFLTEARAAGHEALADEVAEALRRAIQKAPEGT